MSWNKLSSYKTTIVEDGADLSVTYHATTIVRADAETVTLATGGEMGNWHTRAPDTCPGSVTTKRKLNQASHQFGLGFTIHQHRKQWFVTTKAGCFAWPEDINVLTFDRGTGVPDLDFAVLAEAKAKGEKQCR